MNNKKPIDYYDRIADALEIISGDSSHIDEVDKNMDYYDRIADALENIAESGDGIGGNNAIKGLNIDNATNVISLKNKNNNIIEGSNATLPSYGISFNSTTGSLALTKNGTAIDGQTVTIPNYGSPVGVSSANDMIDHNIIYLYTGSTDSNYTYGHFYCWDGTAWVDGGEYGAAFIQTDKTLSIENRAADASAVGAAIADNNNNIENLKQQYQSTLITKTASGSLVTFSDGIADMLINTSVTNINPIQSGSGDPTPNNIRPITGRTGITITRSGKNLLPNVTKIVNSANIVIGQTSSYATNWDIHLFPGIYVVSATLKTPYYLKYINKSGTIAGNTTISATPFTILAIQEEDDFAFWIYSSGGVNLTDIVSFQLEQGSVVTNYEEYIGETFRITFPLEAGTVYGGIVGATAGTLTVDKTIVDMGTLTWNKATQYGHQTFWAELPGGPDTPTFYTMCSNYKSIYDLQYTSDNIIVPYGNSNYNSSRVAIRDDTNSAMTAEQFKTNISGAQLVYELAEPIVYNFTPIIIQTLAGINHIWADCGLMKVGYARNTGSVIEAGDINTRAMIGEASGEKASRSLTVGEYITIKDKLYRVISNIGTGETLIPNSNIIETTVGIELTSNISDNRNLDIIENLKILAQIADKTYAGRDLTTIFSSEITQYGGDAWAWIKARITEGNFEGIHIGDYIPWTDLKSPSTTRNARIMGIDTYLQYGDNDNVVNHHIDFFGGLWTPNKPINKSNYNNGTSESEFPWLASDAYLYANSLSGSVPSTATENPELTNVDYTDDGIYFYLPSDLKTQIVQKRIYAEKRYTADSLLTNFSSGGWTDIGKIWFPTEFEVYGASIWSGNKFSSMGSSVQYPLFANNMNRLIFGRYGWWLLNPCCDMSDKWCNVGSDGFATGSNAAYPYITIPICFRIA